MIDTTGAMVAGSVAPSSPQPSPGVSDFLGGLFRLLEEFEIRYCVLHAWEELPERLSSDLDLAVHPEDAVRLPLVVRALQEQGYLPIQLLRYAVHGYRYDFAWLNGCSVHFAGIDTTYEYHQGGLTLMSGRSLVGERQRRGDLWVASPEAEFAYLLAKKAGRGSVSLRQQQRLRELVEELGSDEAAKITGRLFGERHSTRLVEACVQGRLPDLLREFKKRLWWTTVARDPLNPVRNLIADGWRRARRWFQPTGLFVAVLGPDGVGKSTVIAQLTEKLAPGFRGHGVFHWRPMLLHPSESEGPVTNPHGKPPRGWMASAAIASVLVLDYWLGYLFLVWPLLARTRLVVFDRYFHDALVDPARYRYGGPMWFLQLLSRLVRPRDSLFIILDADENVILSRKSEVPGTELGRQREAYQQLAARLHTTPVRTDQSLEHTMERVAQQILEHLAQRFQHRQARWLALGQNAQIQGSRSTARV